MIALARHPLYTQPVCDQLRYVHRTYFSGYELYQRKQQKLAEPGSIKVAEFEDQVKDIFWINGDEIVTPAGMLSRVWSVLTGLGFTPRFVDHRKLQLPDADYSQLSRVRGFEMRYRVDDILTTIAASRGGVIHLPTGMGKTMTLVAICAVYPRARITIILPGRDLLASVRERIVQCINELPGIIGDGQNETGSRITLCSADSIHKLDMAKQHLILYDEVHTAATEVRSAKLLGQYTDANMFGFSANVGDRADNADALVEAIFGPVILEVSYEEAAEAGSVAQLMVQPIRVPMIHNFEARLPKSKDRYKRYCYTVNSARNDVIARAVHALPHLLPNVSDPQVLVMCETVEHIFHLASRLPVFQTVYANMSDEMRERLTIGGMIGPAFEPLQPGMRAQLLREFESGALKRVIANHCWKQGIDPRHLNVLVRADGGTSEINSTQIPGRLSRVVEGKPPGLLIDFDDTFLPWAKQRWMKRLKTYSSLGYKILETISI